MELEQEIRIRLDSIVNHLAVVKEKDNLKYFEIQYSNSLVSMATIHNIQYKELQVLFGFVYAEYLINLNTLIEDLTPKIKPIQAIKKKRKIKVDKNYTQLKIDFK